MLPKDKERVLVEIVERVLSAYHDGAAVERAIYDTLYEERRRLETERDRKEAARQRAFYDRIYSDANGAAPEVQRRLLKEIVRAFAAEVAGHFDPRIYAAATRLIPPALSVLLNAASPLRLLTAATTGFANLEDQLRVEGEVETLQHLATLGTTVLVPTHLSNLDSIVIGYALHRMGLPPYIYGAGLNLFHNKLIGFFMHHLGAYKVDRRKKALLYKDVLKTYAGCTLEAGYHNLFFPGGTRSRNGGVENHLKLGLLGMGLSAYVHNLAAGKAKPDIFVVPCTLNYQLVLEAETLIDDHLKEVGKSRYIIEDDEFSKPRRILDFIEKLLSLNSRIHLVISRPLDVFGNEVDDDGHSKDSRGRRLDRTRYVARDGGVGLDPQRDAEYTHELADSVRKAYRRDTLVSSTHALAYTVFRLLRARNPEVDLYKLLRTGGKETSFSAIEVYERLERLLDQLRRLAADGRLWLDDTLAKKDTVAVANDALAHLMSYHRHPAVVRRGDRLFHEDRNLLLYYHNRLDSLGLPGLEVPR
ncbi:MAG: 1-acyl-sn-glycerol-3-phosphate acyltransferase [Deltaproteobacteria bacterium]|nr:1-acyl-sn-glycerol-3-phosphate acyltransferase [Deltaproteobacteria bacterium]